MYQIHQIPLPIPYGEKIVFVYLIEAEKLTLVDAGIKTEKCWDAFCEELKLLGYQIEDIKRVILTHHHPDHCGMLDYFPHKIEILGHEKNNQYISKSDEHTNWYDEFFKSFDKEMGIPDGMVNRLEYAKQLQALSCNKVLTNILKEADMIAGFKVIETPGHASSHISLYREEDGILIGGDMLLQHITPNPIIEAPENRKSSRQKVLLSYLESLEKLSKLKLSKVYPGHGDIFENVQEVIEFQIQSQQNRAKRVVDIIGEKAKSAYEISKELYPKLYKKEFSLTLSQTIGQLDYLLNKSMISSEKIDGIYYFRLNKDKM